MKPTMVIAAMLCLLALVFGVEAFQLGFWVDDNPGPGVLPLVASVLLLPLSILSLRERPSENATGFSGYSFLAIVVLIAYACAVPYGGFVLPTLVLIALWCKIFHRQSWLRSILCSASLTIFGIVIFAYLLQVPIQLLPVAS